MIAREAAVGVQPQHLGLDQQLREALADHRVLGRRRARSRRATRARARSARRARSGRSTWSPNASVARSCISVVIATAQPFALAADDVLVRDPRLLDEQLVELGLAGDLDGAAGPGRRPAPCPSGSTSAPCAWARPGRCARPACTTWRGGRTSSTPSGRSPPTRRRRAPRGSSATPGRSPASGSEKPWHQISSPDRIGGR